MGIASVMSTLFSLSITTCSNTTCSISLRCSSVNSSMPWPTSFAHERTASISRRFSLPLASRAWYSSSFALALSSRSVMNLR